MVPSNGGKKPNTTTKHIISSRYNIEAKNIYIV